MSLSIEPEQPRQEDQEVITPLAIRRAMPEDVYAVWNIIRACANQLSEQEIHHWSTYYSEELVAKMIAKKEVYLGLCNGTAVGTVTIGTQAPKYYSEAGYGDRFSKPEEPAVYISALAVLPEQQQHGFAGEMLRYVEGVVAEKQISWLRLDCRAEVPGLVGFYEHRGFNRLGEEPVDEGEDGTYWLMEKRVGISTPI